MDPAEICGFPKGLRNLYKNSTKRHIPELAHVKGRVCTKGWVGDAVSLGAIENFSA